MDEKLQQAYLYDFYGELLNQHQRQIYEDFVFNDLSLGEIAQEEGISRQGVCDMVKRCDKKLLGYEEKLHLVEKFLAVKKRVEEIHRLTRQATETGNPDKPEDGDMAGSVGQETYRPEAGLLEKIERISNEILEEL